ncbi:MAG: FAD-binding oxidoreductase [Burkholderiaceae bacterium]|nr:FAD-binding oxidoreductase [Burkholderiaceae bacterium]
MTHEEVPRLDGDAFAKVQGIVGVANASRRPEDLLTYMSDSYSLLMRREVPLPECVVMPEETDQVQALMRLANSCGIPVYPRSSGVNIAASAIPYRGGIVLDLKRMTRIWEIDEDTMTATVEPGVSWGKLRKEANRVGLDAMPILGPYRGGPVGNFLLTNVTAYSSKRMADRAATLEVVMPNGELLRTGSWAGERGDLNRYFRYAYGPDLTGLFRGSLGNFGVVTKMVTMLRPRMQHEDVALYGFDDFDQAMGALKHLERLDITRYAFFFSASTWKHVFLSPKAILDPVERGRVEAQLPAFLMSTGLGGMSRQFELNRELVNDVLTSEGGRELVLGAELTSIARELSEGGSQKVLRMFTPYTGFMPLIACVPPRHAAGIRRLGADLAKKYELLDPVDGSPLDPEVIVIPYDRCSTVYVEQEFLFNRQDQSSVDRAGNCIREAYSRATSEFGAVHTIPNRSLLKRINPAYAEILSALKHVVDPSGILQGGAYSLE